MRVIVNGQEIETSAKTLFALIEELGVRPAAVEVNLEIVKKTDYQGFVLRDGDRVEIVQFVGGG